MIAPSTSVLFKHKSNRSTVHRGANYSCSPNTLAFVSNSSQTRRSQLQLIHSSVGDPVESILISTNSYIEMFVYPSTLAISLLWFGWSAHHETNYIVPIIALIPFTWGNLCTFYLCNTQMVDTYKASNSASVLAANGVLRYVVRGVVPPFVVQIY
jgi:hypothetical protein